MKKLLLLMLLILPMFADAQGKVYRKDSREAKDLVFTFDGVDVVRVGHDGKEDKRVGKYKDGYLYTINSKGEPKAMCFFDGKNVYHANDRDRAFIFFDGKYIYNGHRADPNQILGCIVNKKYYRGATADPDKLVMSIEGEIPIVILLFLNVG